MKQKMISNKSKAYFLALLFVGIIVTSACNPLDDVSTPRDFDIYIDVDDATYKVGDTVIFNIEGDPDIISFYSGESGNDYAYVDKDRMMEATAELSFKTQVRKQNGPAAYCQDDQLSIYVSDDFVFERNAGKDSVNAVQNATWVDITSLFTLPVVICSGGGDYLDAKVKDITNLFEKDKPLYLAFKYKNRPYMSSGNGNIWRFSGLTLNAVTAAGSVSLLTQNTANWMPVFIGDGWATTGFSNTGTVVMMRGGATNDTEQELWCISEPCILPGETNLGEDKAIGIKSAMDVALTSYKYTYTKAGVYNVTFVGRNSNIYDQKEVIRHIKITVTD